MARIPVNSCGHVDFPCCGCDDVVLTGEDAIEAMEDWPEDFDYDEFDEFERQKYEEGLCPHCLCGPCVCDQLHDMAVEDRLGGGW